MFRIPLTFNSTMSSRYISKLVFITISLLVLCASNIRRQWISNLHRNRPLRIPIHTLAEFSLGDSFLVPRKNHVRQYLDWNRVECATTGPTLPASKTRLQGMNLCIHFKDPLKLETDYNYNFYYRVHLKLDFREWTANLAWSIQFFL